MKNWNVTIGVFGAKAYRAGVCSMDVVVSAETGEIAKKKVINSIKNLYRHLCFNAEARSVMETSKKVSKGNAKTVEVELETWTFEGTVKEINESMEKYVEVLNGVYGEIEGEVVFYYGTDYDDVRTMYASFKVKEKDYEAFIREFGEKYT